jgi:FkbM family methyltransferase
LLDPSTLLYSFMPHLIPYGLRKIWAHPANRAPGGLRSFVRRMGRSGGWWSYQLQKQLGLFPVQGRVIAWIDGLRVRLLSSSQQSQACLYYGTPDWPSMQFLRRYLRPGDLCADIGANVGIYSLLIARHAGAAHVHAFECLPGNIPKLRANLALNGLERVVVHAVALADRDGLVTLNSINGDCTASISPPLPSAETCDETDACVQARRLDGFSWPGRFAYIKIDVEGAEQLVLSGSEHLLRTQAPMVWSFELLNIQQRLGFSKEGLLQAFARWHYRFFLYRPRSNTLVLYAGNAHGHWPQRHDDNVLAIHASAVDGVARRLCGLE